MKHLTISTFLFILLLSMAGITASAHDIEVANEDGKTVYYIWTNNKTELAVSYQGSYYDSYSGEYSGNVVIPESVTYNGVTYSVTSIGSSAFEHCSSLTSVTIPNSVTNIGGSAFSGCSSLTSVTIPNSVTSIGGSAFYGTAWYNNQPDGVVYAGKVAYKYKGTMPANTSISLQEGTLGIADEAFYICSGLTSVTIPNSVTSIGDYAFNGCSGLTSVTIPNSVTSIGSYAFQYCSGLTSVTIPNSVTSIGNYAFSDCSKLESVTIGTGVLTIGGDVFYNHKPAKVIWLTNTPPSGYSYAAGTVNYVANDQYTSLSNKTVYPFLSSWFEVGGVKYVPVSPSERTCDAIDCIYGEEATDINIGETVTYRGIELAVKNVKPYVCYQNSYINNVDVSSSGAVGERAFYGCTRITRATLSNKGSIGNYAFSDCTLLAEANVNNAGSIYTYAFSGCTQLAEANVNNAGTIGTYAFNGCTGMQTLSIGSDVTNISDYAFYNCGMTTATINNKGTIGGSVFQDCSKMTSATLGSGITSIGQYAFDGCSKLKGIVIPNAVTSIGQYAFQNCLAMSSATIGTAVQTIGKYAFSGCKSIREIEIPQSVTTISDYVFSGCTKLKNVLIDDRTISATTITLADWTSTNTAHGSTSSKTYSFTAYSGSELSFNYWVSSESGCDKLIVTLDGSTVLEKSGEQSGTYTKTFTEYGTHKLIVKYTKDSSTSKGSDKAKITNLSISGYEGSLLLGSNGSSPLFADCPLDSVYIGGKLSYYVNSDHGYSPFYRHPSLRSVMIADKETEISENEFYGCTGLKNVFIGDGVTTIGNWAFSGCSSLDHFAFGSSVTSIGQEAFSDCTAMTLIKSHAATPPTCGANALDDISKWDCTLEVPKGSATAYQAAAQWKEFFFTQEENASSIFYKLTYMVDGETYKTYSLHYGDAIEAEPDPVKEGYAFSGWSEVPATMPARDVVVRGSFTLIPVEDVSGDTAYLLSADPVDTQTGAQTALPIAMKNEAEIVGFQFDLTLPEGITLAPGDGGLPQVTLGDRIADADQAVSVMSVGEGNRTWRFVSYSLQNTAITGTSGTVLSAMLSTTATQGAYDAQITKAVLTRRDGTQLKLQDSAFRIVVCNLDKGDANGDGEVNVTDIVEMVNDIMERPSDRFVDVAADMNIDGEVNVTDIVLVVGVIMGDDEGGASRMSAPAPWASTANDQLSLVGGLGQGLSLWLTNEASYVAAQMDIRLSAGLTLEGVALNSLRSAGHLLTCDKIGDGHYRVVVCSLSGSALLGNSGELLSLDISGEGTTTVERILLVTADAAEKHFAPLTCGTTGIDTIAGQSEPADVYTTDGRLVRRQATSLSGLKKGIYVVNGKKMVVR